jgi:hypothetical protein
MAYYSFPGFKGETVEVKSGVNKGSSRELKAVGRHEWRMATAPLDVAADGSAPPAGARASHTMYVTQWNDSSSTKDVRIASTCLFGDSYETTIGRKLKSEDLKDNPALGCVGDKVRSCLTIYGYYVLTVVYMILRVQHSQGQLPTSTYLADPAFNYAPSQDVQRVLQFCRHL